MPYEFISMMAKPAGRNPGIARPQPSPPLPPEFGLIVLPFLEIPLFTN